MQSLVASIKGGWALSKKECDSILTLYNDMESELVEDRGIIFLGEPAGRTYIIEERNAETNSQITH